jgi:hypothetical protein
MFPELKFNSGNILLRASKFPLGNKLRLFLSRATSVPWRKLQMILDEQYSEELRALRNLERTVRAYGVTAQLVPVKKRQEMLAAALREVVDARKAAIRRSRRVPMK